jgi:pre-mRNA-processing factor 6
MTSVTTAVQGDWKAARDLVENLTQTNSSYGRGWVVAARLDEGVGKLHSARKKIMQATKMCPSDEEVWLEAVRLQLPENAPKVIAEALQNIPTSVKLWLKAVDLEKEAVGKKVAIRKALEAIPNSVRLWKIAVEMEEPDNAKILLSRAVECCPQSVDLWLALAHLEDYQNAKAVLNRARENIPTEKQIWIAAAKLEEANGNDSSVDKRIQMGVSSLKRNGVEINREEWIKSAIHCEHSGSVVTAQAIIRAVAPIGVEEEDRKHTWLEDADQCKRENAPECARHAPPFSQLLRTPHVLSACVPEPSTPSPPFGFLRRSLFGSRLLSTSASTAPPTL